MERVVVEGKGMILERLERGVKWHAVERGDLRVELGQMVTANGRFGAEKGTQGIVIEIIDPQEENRTSDIIRVWFEGHHSPAYMKFKDLEF